MFGEKAPLIVLETEHRESNTSLKKTEDRQTQWSAYSVHWFTLSLDIHISSLYIQTRTPVEATHPVVYMQTYVHHSVLTHYVYVGGYTVYLLHIHTHHAASHTHLRSSSRVRSSPLH